MSAAGPDELRRDGGGAVSDGAAPAAPEGGLPEETAVGRHLAAFLGADHVAVVLSAGPGFEGVLRGSSPPLLALLDMVGSVGEGPTTEVLRSGRGVVVPDLGAETDRWPLLLAAHRVPEAVRCLAVLPLDGGLRPPEDVLAGPGRPDEVVGLLLLAGRSLLPMPPAALAAAVRGAALLAAMVLARAEEAVHGGLDLDLLLDPRADVLPRALGVLAERVGLSAGDARRHLQALAFGAGVTVHEAALRLLADGG
ncbi:GAF and ANTAR domain-containing protein [Pseudokineococcus lusitanus]|uniref:ANTAR domain-containing protein n=1 Tax=Pseudokineococcus lusitanus TaxID=763993 RepID=A0A3N1GX29_9ACTN|nr:GAF and ANTAR domain-containing protein [Pseudokineococcus lusitanus]ROP34787.1 hypothetical protein EDC03_2609 [Pseudokineococcus lusitanus]